MCSTGLPPSASAQQYWTWTSVHLVTMLTLVYVPRDCMFQLDSGHWQSRTAWLSSQKILCWHIADENQQEFEWEGLGSIVIWEDKVVPKTKPVQNYEGSKFQKRKAKTCAKHVQDAASVCTLEVMLTAEQQCPTKAATGHLVIPCHSTHTMCNSIMICRTLYHAMSRLSFMVECEIHNLYVNSW